MINFRTVCETRGFAFIGQTVDYILNAFSKYEKSKRGRVDFDFAGWVDGDGKPKEAFVMQGDDLKALFDRVKEMGEEILAKRPHSVQLLGYSAECNDEMLNHEKKVRISPSFYTLSNKSVSDYDFFKWANAFKTDKELARKKRKL